MFYKPLNIICSATTLSNNFELFYFFRSPFREGPLVVPVRESTMRLVASLLELLIIAFIACRSGMLSGSQSFWIQASIATA